MSETDRNQKDRAYLIRAVEEAIAWIKERPNMKGPYLTNQRRKTGKCELPRP